MSGASRSHVRTHLAGIGPPQTPGSGFIRWAYWARTGSQAHYGISTVGDRRSDGKTRRPKRGRSCTTCRGYEVYALSDRGIRGSLDPWPRSGVAESPRTVSGRRKRRSHSCEREASSCTSTAIGSCSISPRPRAMRWRPFSSIAPGRTGGSALPIRPPVLRRGVVRTVKLRHPPQPETPQPRAGRFSALALGRPASAIRDIDVRRACHEWHVAAWWPTTLPTTTRSRFERIRSTRTERLPKSLRSQSRSVEPRVDILAGSTLDPSATSLDVLPHRSRSISRAGRYRPRTKRRARAVPSVALDPSGPAWRLGDAPVVRSTF